MNKKMSKFLNSERRKGAKKGVDVLFGVDVHKQQGL